MTTEKTCKGPGKAKGEACGRTAVAHELCAAHGYQLRARGMDFSALTPLLGPKGKRYEGAVRLEVRGVPTKVVKALKALGRKVPHTDGRQSSPVNLGARHLVTAYERGGVAFADTHDPEKVKPALECAPSGKAADGRVDVRNATPEQAATLKALGLKAKGTDLRLDNDALVGARYLFTAYAEGGVRLLGEWAPRT